MHKSVSNSGPWAFADNEICLIALVAPILAAMLGHYNSDLWYLGYKNIFCWLKPVPCGNVLMRSLKQHVLRNAVNTYSSLSGLCLVRILKSSAGLSACGLPHCLPFAFRSGVSCVQWSRGVAELERHHQHCSSRENFPSDKITKPATMFWSTEATSLYSDQALAENMFST